MTPDQFMANFGAIAEAPSGLIRLREVVLSRAIRGALVEAESDDAQAEVAALEEALAERVRKKEFRKNKPPGSTYDELRWSIPDHWHWTRLDQLGAIGPRNHLNDDTTASFVPMPTVPEGFSGSISGTEDRPWKSIKKQYTHLADGDVALAKITPCFQNRKSVVVEDLSGGFGAGTTELHVFRPAAKELIDPRFVLIWLKSPEFVDRGVGFMTGTAGQQRIPRDYFSASPFPFPPLAEQKRIVAKVEHLMAILDELEQLQEKKRAVAIHVSKASLDSLVNTGDPDQLARAWERISKNFGAVADTNDGRAQLRAALLDLAIAGQMGTREASDDDPAAIVSRASEERRSFPRAKIYEPIEPREEVVPQPSGWTHARLDELCWFIDYRGRTPKKVEQGVRLITAKNVRMGFVNVEPQEFIREEDYEPWMTRGYPTPGDVLFTTEAPLGNVAQLFFDEPVALAQRIITIHPLGGMVPRFLMFTMMCPRFQQKLLDESSGVTARGIKAARLKKLVVPVPPAAEQERIVTVLDSMLSRLDRVQKAATEQESAGARLARAAVSA